MIANFSSVACMFVGAISIYVAGTCARDSDAKTGPIAAAFGTLFLVLGWALA